MLKNWNGIKIDLDDSYDKLTNKKYNKVINKMILVVLNKLMFVF